MKICSKCNIAKEYTEFHKRPEAFDGYRTYCKACKASQDRLGREVRLSQPGEKDRVTQQGRERYLKKTPEELQHDRDVQALRAAKNSKEKKDKFFAEHGCTLQEFKWKQDGIKFAQDSLQRNGDKYNYSKVVYKGVWELVDIFCNKHQSYFQQSPKSHGVGSGCNLCGKEAVGDALRKTQEEFIIEAAETCDPKYTFELSKYVDNKTPLLVTCSEHGPFKITPGSLLSAGSGCPDCATFGYKRDKPGSIYVLTNGEITKIGITNRAVEQRLKEINKGKPGFSILYQERFEDGCMPYSIEYATKLYLKSIHKSPEDRFDGYTECFYNVNNASLLNMIKQHVINIEGMYDSHRSILELGPPPPPSFGFWGPAPLAGCSISANS